MRDLRRLQSGIKKAGELLSYCAGELICRQDIDPDLCGTGTTEKK